MSLLIAIYWWKINKNIQAGAYDSYYCSDTSFKQKQKP